MSQRTNYSILTLLLISSFFPLYFFSSLTKDIAYIDSHKQLAQAASTLSNGLVAHYRFDEGSGTTATDSAGTNTGTLTNGPTFTTGKVGSGALSFDGVDDRVNLGTPSAMDISGAISISAWINTKVLDTSVDTIVSNTSSIGNNFQWDLEINRTSGKVSFVHGSTANGTAIFTNNKVLSTNRWYHVVAVRTGSSGSWTVNFYIDGVSDGAPTDTENPGTQGTSFIGNQQIVSTRAFNGFIDDVRVYNRALSVSEILEIYNLGAVVVEPNNQAPLVNAGNDQEIFISNPVSLSGLTSDDGLPAGSTLVSTWSKVAGPGNVSFSNSSSLITTASFSQSGTYTLRLTSNDTLLSSFDDLNIVVNPDVAPQIDIIPPLVSGILISNIKHDSVAISWSTNEPTNSYVEYGLTSFYGSTTLSSNLLSSHTQNLTGLQPDTNYHFKIKSKDSSNNLGESPDQVFKTILSSPVSSKDIYISQNMQGSGAGDSCQNSQSSSWFNLQSNWGTGINQIGPGDVVHLCGLISTTLIIKGSGTLGSPITIYFENNSKLSQPAGPLMNTNGKDFLIIDGGLNGVMENTDNGSSLNYKLAVFGITASGSENIEIKNLTIKDLYVHNTVSDNTSWGVRPTGIYFNGVGNNVSIHHNHFDDMTNAMTLVTLAGGSGIDIYNNEFTNCDHGLSISGAPLPGYSGVNVYNNHFGTTANWDTTSNLWHHDGIHIYHPMNNVLSNIKIYNNTFDGDWGVNNTAHIFMEGEFGGVDNPGSGIKDTLIYNNVFKSSNAKMNNGALLINGLNTQVINNTFIGSGKDDVCVMSGTNDFGLIFKNNLLSSCGLLIGVIRGIANNQNFNNNLYSNGFGSQFFQWQLTSTSTVVRTSSLNVWQSNLKGDGNSRYVSDAGFDAGGYLKAGSLAIDFGENLSVLGIDTLNFDKDGRARPQSTSWDIGAYEYVSGSPTPPPTPTNGSCSTTLNQCTTGTFQDVTDTTTNNLWNCLGSNGGTTASCSSAKAPVSDTTAPTITSVATSSVSQVEATITWTTNEPSTSQIEYGFTNSYGSFTTLNSTLATTHTEKITNLNNNTTYHFRVISKDSSSNIGQSQDFSFTTFRDITPPVRSNGLPTGTLASSTLSVVVSLTTDEPSMCYYSNLPSTPFAQMSAVFTTTGDKNHSMNFSVQAGSSYFIYVRCRDTALNANTNDFPILFSVASKTVTQDVNPPQVSISYPAGGETIDEGSLTITTATSDDVAVTGLTFYLNNTKLGTELSKIPFSTTTNLTVGSYNLFAVARDQANNYATSSKVFFTIAAKVVVPPPPTPPSSGGGGSPAPSGGGGGGGSPTPTTSTKPFVHGSCLTTNNQCASGTLLDTIDSSIEYLWTCEGSGGGMSSYCKTLKPAYEIPPSILNPKTTTNQPVFNRPLALGQEGEDVKQLQKFLNNNGYIIKSEGVGSPGQETNYFGFATEGALKRFQCAVLKICSGGSYGVLDQTTINAIKNKTPTKILPSQNLGGQAKYTFTKTLKLGQKGEDVKQLQKFLNNNGFPVASTGPGSKGNETTTFGPATQRAVIKFQEAYAKDVLTPSGLKKGTGTFGPATLKKVNGM